MTPTDATTPATQAILPVTAATISSVRRYVRHDADCHVSHLGEDAPCSCGARVALLCFDDLVARQSLPLPGDDGMSLAKVVHENGPVVVDQMGEGLAWRPLDYGTWTALTPSGDAGEGELPDDVRRLVIAARAIAFNDWDGDSEEWTVARKELDDASEAFASRVPWDDQPAAHQGAGE